MPKTTRDYLLDILTYIGYLETFVADGRQHFEHDVRTQLAVRQAYQVIGEILKRLPDPLLSQQPQIRWKDIKGFRDILIHQYDSISIDRVWLAIEDLPNLRTAVEVLLASLRQADDDMIGSQN